MYNKSFENHTKHRSIRMAKKVSKKTAAKKKLQSVKLEIKQRLSKIGKQESKVKKLKKELKKLK